MRILLTVLVISAGIRQACPAACTPVPVSPAQGAVVPDTRSADDPLTTHSADMSIPEPTRFIWTAAGSCAAVRYDLYVSEDSVFGPGDPAGEALTDTAGAVYNLKTGTAYFWKIIARSGSLAVGASPVRSFKTPDVWPRMLYIDGITNARDISGSINGSGYRVRQGMYIRTSELSPNHLITDTGIAQVMDLGIACELDLRSEGEEAVPMLPPEVRYYRVCGPGEYFSPYWYGLQTSAPNYLEVFRELARRSNYPILVHCQLGMDRAGTVTALLEALLGVSDDRILLDYQWSSLSVHGERGTEGAYAWSDWNDLINGLKGLDPAGGTLQAGAENHLLSIGITPAEIDSIRDILLEDEPAGIDDAGTAVFKGTGTERLRPFLPFIDRQSDISEHRAAGGEIIDLSGSVLPEGSGIRRGIHFLFMPEGNGK